jgi:hypothetical protein
MKKSIFITILLLAGFGMLSFIYGTQRTVVCEMAYGEC